MPVSPLVIRRVSHLVSNKDTASLVQLARIENDTNQQEVELEIQAQEARYDQIMAREIKNTSIGK